jgi:hypothetical protein
MYKSLQDHSKQGTVEIVLVVLVCGRRDGQTASLRTYTLAFSLRFCRGMLEKRAQTVLSLSRAVYIHPKQTFSFVNSVITYLFIYLFIYLLV